jgi:hypothetical protein
MAFQGIKPTVFEGSSAPDTAGIFMLSMMGTGQTPETPIKMEDGLLGQATAFNDLSMAIRRQYSSVRAEGIKGLKAHGGSMEEFQKLEREKMQRGEEDNWLEKYYAYLEAEKGLANMSALIDQNKTTFDESYRVDKDKLHQVVLDPVTGQGIENPETGAWMNLGDYYRWNQRNLGFGEDGMPMMFQPPTTYDPAILKEEINTLALRIGSISLAGAQTGIEGAGVPGLRKEAGPGGEEIISIQRLYDLSKSNEPGLHALESNIYNMLSNDARRALYGELLELENQGMKIREEVAEMVGGEVVVRKRDISPKEGMHQAAQQYAGFKLRNITSPMREVERNTYVVTEWSRLISETGAERQPIYQTFSMFTDSLGDERNILVTDVDDKGNIVHKPVGDVKTLNTGNVADEFVNNAFKGYTNTTLMQKKDVTIAGSNLQDFILPDFGSVSRESIADGTIVGFAKEMALLPTYEKAGGKLTPKLRVEGTGKDPETDEEYYTHGRELHVAVDVWWRSMPSNIKAYLPQKDGTLKQGAISRKELRNYNIVKEQGGGYTVRFYVHVPVTDYAFWTVDAKHANSFIQQAHQNIANKQQKEASLAEVDEPLN